LLADRVFAVVIFFERNICDEIKENIRDILRCHFEDDIPKIIRINLAKEEVFAAWRNPSGAFLFVI